MQHKLTQNDENQQSEIGFSNWQKSTIRNWLLKLTEINNIWSLKLTEIIKILLLKLTEIIKILLLKMWLLKLTEIKKMWLLKLAEINKMWTKLKSIKFGCSKCGCWNRVDHIVVAEIGLLIIVVAHIGLLIYGCLLKLKWIEKNENLKKKLKIWKELKFENVKKMKIEKMKVWNLKRKWKFEEN